MRKSFYNNIITYLRNSPLTPIFHWPGDALRAELKQGSIQGAWRFHPRWDCDEILSTVFSIKPKMLYTFRCAWHQVYLFMSTLVVVHLLRWSLSFSWFPGVSPIQLARARKEPLRWHPHGFQRSWKTLFLCECQHWWPFWSSANYCQLDIRQCCFQHLLPALVLASDVRFFPRQVESVAGLRYS